MRYPVVNLGTKMTVRWKDLATPEDAKPPEGVAGCIYIGGRSAFSAFAIEKNIKDAQAAGYTDIHELDVPPCDPAKDFAQCQIVGGNPPYKYVWACPVKGTLAPSVPSVPQPAGPDAAPAASPPVTPIIVGAGVAAAGAAALLLAGRRSVWLGQVPLAKVRG